MKHKVINTRIILIILIVLVFIITSTAIAYYYRADIQNGLKNARYLISFDGERTVNNLNYEGEVTPDKRFLTIGFDDFRETDFTHINPLLSEYEAKSTFNRIAYNSTLSDVDIAKIDILTSNGHEIGDHTWFHCEYIYNDPLCNGQIEGNEEGDQQAFPSNTQLRENYGNNKNAFGFDIEKKVCDSRNWDEDNCLDWAKYNISWKDLSDEQCQEMRNTFSLYKDSSGKIDLLDSLSNKYCGTTGSSKGSWDKNKNCYTGGIFSGCKTSCNHEVWERILEITRLFYKDQYSQSMTLSTWSWPGDVRSPFAFTTNCKQYYYDSSCTKPYNYLATFPSSLYFDENGCSKTRSWTQLLREYNYKVVHDTWYPSRADGTEPVAMSIPLIFNANLSRQDALTYRTNNSVSFSDIASEYPEKFFSTSSGKSKAAQMYDSKGSFYRFIEAIRNDTSNGMIRGEVIDSSGTFSEEVFLRSALDYCKKTGVEVVTKAEAYDICFNHPIRNGNLIYNSTLRNTAKEFLPDALSTPNNPDGYYGDCEVKYDSKNPVLSVHNNTYYLHYGIPCELLNYSAEIKGNGRINIYGIQNASNIKLDNTSLQLLGSVNINSDMFNNVNILFNVPNNNIGKYDYVCEGYGDKIMGIKIDYSGNLDIKNIKLNVANQ